MDMVARIATGMLDLDAEFAELDALIKARFHDLPHAKVIETLPGMGPRLGAEFSAATGGDLTAFGTPAGWRASPDWPRSHTIPAAFAATCTGPATTIAACCEPAASPRWPTSAAAPSPSITASANTTKGKPCPRRHGLHHGVEKSARFKGIAAAVPVHVAPLVVVPQLALGTTNVVLPQAHGCADAARLEIVSGAFKTADLGQRTRGQTVDDGGRAWYAVAAGDAGSDVSWPSTRHGPFGSSSCRTWRHDAAPNDGTPKTSPTTAYTRNT
ncbi:hypothetical protein GCM10010245_81620 [Streptomyces spectabilis]|uniref:IS110 family transposase n=1 Tax=Streptomyces spectabilis TaxID=68270 RepID=A0A7W8B3D4_STRST|nr:hypothetical protein [Streptomyces spectabilis]GGV51899.1 hypothetical protein GCM10010245_81620 [Streptomyces spectabilis]